MIRKRKPFNTGDCSIEVTAWVGLTIMCRRNKILNYKSNNGKTNRKEIFNYHSFVFILWIK